MGDQKRIFVISYGRNATDNHPQRIERTWQELIEDCRHHRRAKVTAAQCAEMVRQEKEAEKNGDRETKKRLKDKRSALKNGPFIIPVEYLPGSRKKIDILGCSLLVLELDHKARGWEAAFRRALAGLAWFAYSTFSHTDADPRIRLVIPLANDISWQQYAAISRAVAKQIGIDMVCGSSYRPGQVMYLPTCPKEAAPVFVESQGEFLDPDEVLESYKDWNDPAEWPRSAAEIEERKVLRNSDGTPMQDPTKKPGVVGDFCRAYDIYDAIFAFDLPYDGDPGDTRLNYTDGTGAPGALVHDGRLFMYSWHDDDPVTHRCVNSFDLTRIHKFRHLDEGLPEDTPVTELPSYRAMVELIEGDTEVQRVKTEAAVEGFEVGEVGVARVDAPLMAPTLVTDMRVAEFFAGVARPCCRWWAESKKWLVYDGTRWCTDTPGGAFPFLKKALDVLNKTFRAIPDEESRRQALRSAVALEGHRKQCVVLEAAAVIPNMVISSDQLDADPMLLNCRNGTLDLRTGQLRGHRPEDFITRLINIDFDPAARCPEFLRFLDKIMDGKKDLVDYIQRWFGYSLTGLTIEQVLLFLYGLGCNGKTTFANVHQRLLGDFAATADRAILMHRERNGPGNDLAALRGARLVVVSELNDGERLDEAAVKLMTGGDQVSCRFLFSEFFTYTPAFKMMIFGNHKPKVRGTDHGIWRRVHMLPFRVRITDEEKDPQLPDKLTAELPGILAWAVAGCLEWQRTGLQPPVEVLSAVQEYRASEDIFQQWLDECCDVGPEHRATPSDLLSSFTTFSNWRHMTRVSLGRKLTGAGFCKDNGDRYWLGIAVRPEPVF